MDQIILNDCEHGTDIARCAGVGYNPKTCCNFARVRDDVLMGGVVFSNYTGESIAIHSGSFDPHWINRDMLYVTFDYPFNQLGVKRIFGQVPEDNTHAQEFNLKVGFKYVARIEGVFRHNIACMVMCLERADCRFLKVRPRGIVSNLH